MMLKILHHITGISYILKYIKTIILNCNFKNITVLMHFKAVFILKWLIYQPQTWMVEHNIRILPKNIHPGLIRP